jgi:deoxyribodipyrimidine photo-lyase
MELGPRARLLKSGACGPGPVIAWISRDQRAVDNWMLVEAQRVALAKKVPLIAVFTLVPDYLGATLRQYEFMLRGLDEVHTAMAERGIPLTMVDGDPGISIPEMAQQHDAAMVIVDFDPLRTKREWKGRAAHDLKLPLVEVDAHNVIPSWLVSDHQEFAARTFRPKVRDLLPQFLGDIPPLIDHPYRSLEVGSRPTDMLHALDVDRAVMPVEIVPGSAAGLTRTRAFVASELEGYPLMRNDPSLDGQSKLSPYLHFGHISAQRVALDVLGSDADEEAKTVFLEELIVRKELSDNYCHHNQDYDNFNGLPAWSRKTLDAHRGDPRRPYSSEELEAGETDDPLWNAAQKEMVGRGRMHGHMRMYWAKKFLEWTPSPEAAISEAIRLNDRYELDGRDPNGYVGIAWSIGGLHDRPWKERPIYGTVRYMSFSGAARKFDVGAYIHAQEG